VYKRLNHHSRVPSLSIPNLHLPLHPLLLLPNILPAHSPREAKTSNRRSRSQIENTVHTLAVSDQYTCQFILRDHFPYRGRTSGNHHLGIDGGSVSRKLRPQTVGEDRLREGEEDGAAEGLAEHDEGHGDCDLGLGEGVLDCDDWLWCDGEASISEEKVHIHIHDTRGVVGGREEREGG
jgi:hypothetical protein